MELLANNMLDLKVFYSFQMAAEEESQRLRSQLRERDEQVHQAAQAGLDLLNQQMELQSRLDEQRVEMTNALEVRLRTIEGQLSPSIRHQYVPLYCSTLLTVTSTHQDHKGHA